MDEAQRIKVMIVDDYPSIRQGMRWMLESYADIQVVAEASNGREAIGLTEQLRPSVILMDINMPVMNGIEATGQIMRRYPDTIVIGLSVNAGRENQESMERAGAVRLLPKEHASEVLYEAIHQAVKR